MRHSFTEGAIHVNALFFEIKIGILHLFSRMGKPLFTSNCRCQSNCSSLISLFSPQNIFNELLKLNEITKCHVPLVFFMKSHQRCPRFHENSYKNVKTWKKSLKPDERLIISTRFHQFLGQDCQIHEFWQLSELLNVYF